MHRLSSLGAKSWVNARSEAAAKTLPAHHPNTSKLINEHKLAAHTCARLQNLISTYLKDVNHD